MMNNSLSLKNTTSARFFPLLTQKALTGEVEPRPYHYTTRFVWYSHKKSGALLALHYIGT
jgi:hypothetical protein